MHVCTYVIEYVIGGSNVVRMTMLRERYLEYILENSPVFYNPAYKTCKLKEKLVNHFSDSLHFWQPNYICVNWFTRKV